LSFREFATRYSIVITRLVVKLQIKTSRLNDNVFFCKYIRVLRFRQKKHAYSVYRIRFETYTNIGQCAVTGGHYLIYFSFMLSRGNNNFIPVVNGRRLPARKRTHEKTGSRCRANHHSSPPTRYSVVQCIGVVHTAKGKWVYWIQKTKYSFLYTL